MKTDFSTLYSDRIDKVFLNVVTLEGTVRLPGGNTEKRIFRFCDNDQSITFKGNKYESAAFSVSEPDKDSLEEGTGNFQIAGVTNEHVKLVQQATGKLIMTVGVVRLDQLESGEYIVSPTEYVVSELTIDSKTATLSLSLKTGGALGFFASVSTFSTTNFPGLEG